MMELYLLMYQKFLKILNVTLTKIMEVNHLCMEWCPACLPSLFCVVHKCIVSLTQKHVASEHCMYYA